MKRRKNITRKLRNDWVKKFEFDNRKSENYSSFIKCQDLISSGAKNRTPDFLNIGQDHDFLSMNEHFFYLHLLRDPKITWIKEQYPLLPIQRAISVAKALEVRYPTYPYSDSVEVVMTVDFYCGTVFDYDVTYSIKDAIAINELPNKTKLKQANFKNKQLIERTFFESQAKECKWFLISSESLKTTYSKNLQRLAPFIILNATLSLYLTTWLICFKSYLEINQQLSLATLLQITAKDMQLEYLDVIAMFNHALWHRLVRVDLNKNLQFEKKVGEFNLEIENVS